MKSKKTTTFDGRKGAGDEVLELPMGFLRDDTGNLNFQHKEKVFVTQGYCVTEMHIKNTWII